MIRTVLFTVAFCAALGWLGPTLDYMDSIKIRDQMSAKARAKADRAAAGKVICCPNCGVEWLEDDRAVRCSNNGNKKWVVRLDGVKP